VNICVLVGNPKPGSRTLTLAERLARMIGEAAGSAEPTIIDLADHADAIFRWPSEEMAALSQQVASCDLAVIASPTYKATYTGLLKGFLDRYPALGLRDVCAIPVMTGADKGHSMAPEVNLRPLLVELGALVPTRGLYFETPAMYRLEEVLTGWLVENAAGVRQILATAASKAVA
jgi:FMN reductase